MSSKDDKPKHISVRVLPCTFLLYLISHGILSKNVATLPFVRVAGAKVRLSSITAKLFSTFFERIFANSRFIVSNCYPDFGKWRGKCNFHRIMSVKVGENNANQPHIWIYVEIWGKIGKFDTIKPKIRYYFTNDFFPFWTTMP